MTNDAIQAEIRATRDALAARHGFDVRAMLAAVRARSVAKGRTVVALPPRPVTAGLPPAPVFPAGTGAPTDDAVIREIRAIREAYAAEHGYDVRAMGEALRRSAAARGENAETSVPQPATPPEAA